MQLRKLVTCFGLLLWALTQQAVALGLGEIRLNSALNQPLDAEIRLLSVGELTAEQISVALASPEDFRRVGIPRDHIYTQLRFRVDMTNAAGPVVRVTSRDPVREPYLNFLVEARWTAGRLLREYTLLLDLPTFADDETPAPVAAPAPRAEPTAPRTEPAPTAEPLRPTVPAAPPRPADPPRPTEPRYTGDTYTVRANDTLWEVALRVRPDRGTSVQQTMVALQRLNPEAFINNNINLVREGAVLRVPSAQDIRGVPAAEAINQVAAQNAEWSDSLGIQLDATARPATAPRQPAEPRGQVRLTTPGTGDAAEAGRAEGVSEADHRALQGRLASAQEELDRTNRENVELSARVQDLEEQIQTMERLLELSNEEMRAMQLAAAQREAEAAAEPEPTIDPLAPLPLDEPELEPGIVEVEPEAVAPEVEPTPTWPEAIDEPEVAVTEPAVEPEVEAPVEAPAPIPVVSQPSLVDRVIDGVKNNMMWILLALAGVLAVVLVVYHRRHLDKGFEDDDEFELDALDESPDEDFAMSDDEDAGIDLASDEALPDELLEDDFEPGSAEAETGDVVGEAEIYIAYGKHDQAEEMLLKGLAKEPASAPILMKLLEVYSETQNASSFDEFYARLLGVGDTADRNRAAELRQYIEGAGEFDTSAYTPQADAGSALEDELDLSDSLLEDDTFVSGGGSELDLADDELTLSDDDLLGGEDDLSEAADDEDFSFDLDLDEGDQDADEGLTLSDEGLEADLSSDRDSDYSMSFADDEAATAEQEEDAGIEFDLSLDDLDTEQAPPETPAAPEPEPEKDEMEIEFDLAEDDDIPALEEPAPAPAPTAPPAAEKPTADDDFDFDMDMEGLDLAALDEEMASLDSDIGVAKPEAPSAAKPAPAADADATLSRTPAVSAPAAGDDDDLDFMADADEAATKLDLARAYIDMGDSEGAKDILSEVLQEGNEDQRREAQELLARADA